MITHAPGRSHRSPRIGANTEARFAYEYAARPRELRLRGRTRVAAAIAIAGDVQQLQDLHLDVRHRLSRRLVGTLSYVYEPSKIFDFAFDPSVITSIVQPSSLILGYTYRPYTSNSVVFGILYYW